MSIFHHLGLLGLCVVHVKSVYSSFQYFLLLGYHTGVCPDIVGVGCRVSWNYGCACSSKKWCLKDTRPMWSVKADVQICKNTILRSDLAGISLPQQRVWQISMIHWCAHTTEIWTSAIMVITMNSMVMEMMMMKVVMAKWMKRKVGPALHDVGGRRGPTSCGTSVNTPADLVHCTTYI